MTAHLRQRIIRSVLRRVLSRRCSHEIPRSGREGERVNCFVARTQRNGEPYLLLDSLDGDVVKCRRWHDGSFSVELEENVSSLVNAELFIYHYYGLDRITFVGAWDFLWHRYTGLAYIRIAARRAWHAAAQFLFNRRSLQSQQRLHILRLLVRARLAGGRIGPLVEERGLSYFDVMTELYSSRWIYHPDKDSRSAEVDFLLESLVASKDALKDGITYKATPQSIVTLEQTDEEDRRHREANRLQRWIVILTLIIALGAIVQSGLIRLPTLLDFRGK
jgi:hypothetical protein